MNVEQKRREMFEASQGEKADKECYRRGPCAGMYKNPVMQNRWLGFNAALDAVEIELPDGPACQDMMGTMINQTIDDCRAAIESTGLGLKVKP